MSVTRYPAVGPVFWTPIRLRALRHGLWFGAVAALIIIASNLTGARFGVDAHAYWLTSHRDDLYAIAPRHLDAYQYSPAFAQAIWPLTLLPWPAFCALWLGAVAAAYLWLLAPLPLEWRLPLLLLCGIDVVAGNVWAFFALILV
ncbi:MAG TPA: hypothetical protein VFL73_03210, partial [Solirubrobacteraceae bacterium]|nr:hypothetical protein [Solirubrobacteraceae bacterium]